MKATRAQLLGMQMCSSFDNYEKKRAAEAAEAEKEETN
jgi:hypothetical protein